MNDTTVGHRIIDCKPDLVVLAFATVRFAVSAALALGGAAGLLASGHEVSNDVLFFPIMLAGVASGFSLIRMLTTQALRMGLFEDRVILVLFNRHILRFSDLERIEERRWATVRWSGIGPPTPIELLFITRNGRKFRAGRLTARLHS